MKGLKLHQPWAELIAGQAVKNRKSPTPPGEKDPDGKNHEGPGPGESGRTAGMKALTLYQPWASLIAEGPKNIETRGWRAPIHLIGQRIAIHAGKRQVKISDRNAPLLHALIVRHHGEEWQKNLPLGAVVATAVLAGCFMVKGLSPNGILDLEGFGEMPPEPRVDAYGDFNKGRWLWMLGDIRRLDPPVPAVGQRMLWEFQMPEEPGNGQAGEIQAGEIQAGNQ